MPGLKIPVLAAFLLVNFTYCHGNTRLSTQLNAKLTEHCGETLTIGACSGSTRTLNYAGTAVFKVPKENCTVELITPPECGEENLGIYINFRQLYLPKSDTIEVHQIAGASDTLLKSLTGQANPIVFNSIQSSVAQLLVHNVTSPKLSIRYLRNAHSYMSSQEAVLEVTVLRMERETNFRLCPALSGYVPRKFCDKSGFLHCPSQYIPDTGPNPALGAGICDRGTGLDGPFQPTGSSTSTATSAFLVVTAFFVKLFLFGNSEYCGPCPGC